MANVVKTDESRDSKSDKFNLVETVKVEKKVEIV